MPVTSYNSLKPGYLVSIVLKADQRTGKQVQGTVAQLLTRHNHPRGIKVKLSDGRVGRVQQILPQSSSQLHTSPSKTMSSNNPWADAPSQGSPHNAGQQSQQSQGQRFYSNYNQNPTDQPQQQQYHQGGYSAPQGPPPSQGIRRSNTDQLLAQEGDRAAQVEHMQQYEANAPQSEDDRHQAELQKQFPTIDSSLIAAIYNERKPDMAEIRELLQELGSS
ncbi:uncharacterized protein A1O9_02773 [Exophiala aquamarina CBS 119918]|uniref:Uncharacterized protein n=1 Tax=Exophiala aquamarina CBS 119918 TaxID=1182545 RepID=A0A072PPE6_9EURO|nr:uncharacterized protein A1O9_02773 [Exophiala aquamarina CBS 119918]KEF61208.1 hypothetical protein A1O9_02773 [Exophiala aquamarina CBS 119918]